MGLPNINITFTTLARAMFQRGSKGTLCIILQDSTGSGEYTVLSKEDIPSEISQDNKDAVERALTGNVTTPEKILLKVLGDSEELSDGLSWAELQTFDYLVGPLALDETGAQTIAAWIKTERENGKKSKAVLPEIDADDEGVVSFSASNIQTVAGTFTSAQYCSRIAGILAGTPFTQSATYVTLPEVIDADRLTRAEADEAIDDGKFIIWYDGEKFKTGRAVNSLVTTSEEKGSAFQKIKIVEIMDLIRQDIVKTAEDQFIGKYPNSYDSRCLLLSAIQGYLQTLAADEILGDRPKVEIDTEANRLWLKAAGIDVSQMTDEEIKTANTGSVVHLKATMQILDVIEDIELPILLNQ